MAQPVQFRVHFLGNMEVRAGDKYLTDDIIDTYADADTIIMKSRFPDDDPVNVGINGTVAIPIEFNEHASLQDGDTFVFSKDCIVAVCEYVSGD